MQPKGNYFPKTHRISVTLIFDPEIFYFLLEVDTQSRPFSMPSFELKALIPREYMLYKVSKTPTIIFRLDTTPECCTRVTPHFLRNTLKHTKAASRSARRANHTTRRTSACRSRSVRADRAQKHALATTSKRTVAAAVHVAVHEVDPCALVGTHEYDGPFFQTKLLLKSRLTDRSTLD